MLILMLYKAVVFKRVTQFLVSIQSSGETADISSHSKIKKKKKKLKNLYGVFRRDIFVHCVLLALEGNCVIEEVPHHIGGK